MASLTLTPDYDREADVLYLTIGDHVGPSECEDLKDGITVRYSAFDMNPVGVIVMDMINMDGLPARSIGVNRGEYFSGSSEEVLRALPS
jgi:phage protein D